MKRLFSFVMVLAMVTSLVATPKVALPNKSAKKARTELTLSAVQKQHPQVKDVAKKNIVRKAVIRKAPMAATTFTYSTSVDAQTKDGFTVELGVGSNQSKQAPAAVVNYTTQANEVRLYLGNTITISGPSITGVELTFTKQGTKDYATLSANAGNLVSGGVSTSTDDPKTDVWTGTASSVTFELGTKGQRILTKIVVYGEGGDTPTPVGDTIPLTSLDAFEFGYYGSYSEEGAYNYTLVLYNSQDDNYIPQVGFDIYTEVKDEFIDNFTAEGGNLGLGYSAFYPDAESEGEYFTDASVTITEGEGDNLVVEGIFTTEAGKTYTFSVSAELYIYDADHPYEPEDPTVLNLTAVALEEDTEYGSDGMIYAYLDMEDGSYVGLSYRAATAIQHLPEGTFSIADLEERDSYLTGYDYAGWAAGSFYEDVLGNVYYFVSGTVTVETLDGAINITINATSAHGSTITVTYSGEVTPTPPTPVGDEITVAEAEAIAGALAEGATTTETYTINGYVGTLYDEGDFWLVSEAGGRSDLKVYRPTVDRALTKGDQVQVVGQLQKYVSKSGNVTLEVVNATVTHVGGDVPPTPPTPVGDEITPEQALEIGNALADNATTTTEYRVVGIVSYANNYNTQYGSQTFSMSSDGADSKSNFKAYQCYIDAPGVQVGDKVAVTGKILKYVDKNGTTIEIKQGTVEILSATALLKIMQNAKVKKMLKQGKVIILRDNQIFDLSGMQIK